MSNTSTIRALLLTADPLLITTFTGVSSELGIQAESSEDSDAVSHQLNRARYEAVVLDFDTVSDAGPVLASVHQSRSNKEAVVFAAATNATHINQALQGRAHFLLRRPIEAPVIRRTLYAAYDLMVGGHRRHFRCTASIQVEVKIIRSGESFQCSTINISGNGVAIASPIPLKPAEMLNISLLLPGGSTVCATGIVIWDDQHGKTGVSFQCSDPEMRHRLDSWLDSRFPGKWVAASLIARGRE
ncbi:MAG TPA: PilZ domain-containing protein [Terriglobales bacterium]|jgi:hypothetical protein|nr:PilZ domain-containing protein [Terriglobales bacterium]